MSCFEDRGRTNEEKQFCLVLLNRGRQNTKDYFKVSINQHQQENGIKMTDADEEVRSLTLMFRV